MRQPGRHFLQIPGPTNIPERVLRAMARPTINHREPEFAKLAREVLDGCRSIFRTAGPVMIFPSSGTGSWEAALVNTLSPGDKVLMCETGQFATLWRNMAEKFGLLVDFIPGDWRHGADPAAIEKRLAADARHEVKAVMVVHNETSTGVTSRISEIREAMNRVGHPALLQVDAVSSLGTVDYRLDDWGVDVTITGSQKGLMLPPGLGFNAVSEKALAAAKTSQSLRSYWDWSEMLRFNRDGYFPYTPATNLLYGLREAIALLHEEGLENVFARHQRHGAATRTAVESWGLELVALDPREYSSSTTAVMLPDGCDADQFLKVALEKYDLSLGMGLGKLKGRIFRIGHLGDFNDLMLMGTLAGVEMSLRDAAIPHRAGGMQAAMEVLSAASNPALQPVGRL